VFNQKLTEYLVHIVPWYAGLLGVLIIWLWGHILRARWAIPGWAALILIMSPAGIILKAVWHSDGPAIDSAVAFLRDHTHSAKLIFGSAALIYALNYDSRLLDDPYLGVLSGRSADAVIISKGEEERYRLWATERPQHYSRIMAALSRYRKVYDSDGYKIYVRAP
jgi:hypothetical protein